MEDRGRKLKPFSCDYDQDEGGRIELVKRSYAIRNATRSIFAFFNHLFQINNININYNLFQIIEICAEERDDLNFYFQHFQNPQMLFFRQNLFFKHKLFVFYFFLYMIHEIIFFRANSQVILYSEMLYNSIA